MANRRNWAQYSQTYRSQEVKRVADWVLRGVSGSIVGLPGSGKSNLLGFLCHRPDVLQSHFASHQNKIVLVPIGLNDLPDQRISTVYRVILRSFHEFRDYFDEPLRETIISHYQENKTTSDPFLNQSALRELLLQCRDHQQHIVFVFDRFDDFCQSAPPQMTNTLRGFRDSFKDILSFLIGMRREATYLSDPELLGDLYEVIDTHVCWVGPMNENDAQQLIAQETQSSVPSPTETEIQSFLELSGGYPALLKAICHWWLAASNKIDLAEWEDLLLTDVSIHYRLQEIAAGLNQEELQTIFELQKYGIQNKILSANNHSSSNIKIEQERQRILSQLLAKGICEFAEEGWRIPSKLLATYFKNTKGLVRGRIWLDEDTEQAYQGETPIQDLSPLERNVLLFLLQHPRIQHTKTELIVSAWPDELRKKGVTDDSLYQVIAGLRKKIEPSPTKPCYVITWRGKPEGGYQFFPEGRPG